MVLTMLNTNMVFISKFDPRNIARNAVENVVFYVFFAILLIQPVRDRDPRFFSSMLSRERLHIG